MAITAPRGAYPGNPGWWYWTSGSGMSDARTVFDGHYNALPYNGDMGGWMFENLPWKKVQEAGVGSYNFAPFFTMVDYITEPNVAHPGKVGRYIPNPSGDPFLPVVIGCNTSTFGNSAGQHIAPPWADPAHVLTRPGGNDRKIPFYRTDNTSAPGGTTRTVFFNYMEELAKAVRSRVISGRIAGLWLTESASWFNGVAPGYTPTIYVQAFLDLADHFHSFCPEATLFFGINFINGTSFTYNPGSDTWSNSVANLLFGGIAARAPWMGITWPDMYCYHTGQIQDIRLWCRLHGAYGPLAPEDRTPVLASQDLPQLQNSATATIVNDWNDGLADPYDKTAALAYVDEYGTPAIGKPHTDPYIDMLFARNFIGAQACAERYVGTWNARHNSAVQLLKDLWPLPAGGSLVVGGGGTPGPSLIEVAEIFTDCGSVDDTPGAGGVTFLSSEPFWEDNPGEDRGIVDNTGLTITNTDNPALYQSAAFMNGVATASLKFNLASGGYKLAAGDYYLIWSGANNSGTITNREFSATLHINGTPNVLFVDRDDWGESTTLYEAWDLSYGPFTIPADADVWVELIRGSGSTGGFVYTPIVRGIAFTQSAPGVPPPNPGQPTAPTNLAISAITANGFRWDTDKSTITEP